MEKVKCEQCGAEVPKKKSVMVFNNKSSKAECLCMACYYQRLASIGTSQICESIRKKEDNK